ncbi:FAD-dependent oxidoreductase [Ornithinibacillus caprae]|uniref:FAD-dependent oxidoreductase n=1 Tax=Ornithinibacillus caprae TaxID=2678566 RepID=UPI0018C81542|nr:FAD-dependent oxidoreductase [Ornithinibacillus caprae]
MEYDVVIVGAGLSGLAALQVIQQHSLKVAIIDDKHELGGNYLKRRWLIDHRHSFNRLLDQVIEPSTDVFLNHQAIGLYADNSLGVTDQQTMTCFRAKVVLQSTGARELPEQFEGWQLPGVITLDAYLKLRYIEGIIFPKRIGIVGAHPSLPKVAQNLREEGHEVVLASTNQSVTAFGKDQVKKLSVDGAKHDVDVVISSKGYVPVNELAHLYGYPLKYKKDSGGWAALPVDKTRQTSFFVAGRASGTQTEEESVQSGIQVAHNILTYLEKEGEEHGSESSNRMSL